MRSLDPTIAAWRTEATPTNESYGNHPQICDMFNGITFLLTFIISLIGLAGNATVLWFLGFHMHRNSFHIDILNIPADFFLFCFYITAFLMALIHSILHINIFHYGIIPTGTIMFYIAGLSMLSAISTECGLSVLWPIWYHCHRPRHTSTIMCALLWALSLFLVILDRVYCFHLKESEVDWCENVNFTITVWVFFSFVVLLGSSLVLLSRMLCGSQQKPLTRLYVTILLTVLVSLLCVMPFGIYLFLISWIHSDAYHCILLASFVLSSVSSSANPIIYFFVGSFRQQLWGQNLKLMVGWALHDTPEKEECGGSLPQGTLEMSGSRVE